MTAAPDALVLGRLHADLYPEQIGVPLEAVRTFERFVGGFAGNVGVGLARLGARTAVVSAVGDDGHGRFIRTFLESEGIDTRCVAVDPTARTVLTFCEIRPPDQFPLLAYRPPDAPDWQLRPDQIPLELVRDARVMLVSGTAFAEDPSRSSTRAAMAHRRQGSALPTVLDLDWRVGYWSDPAAYPSRLAEAVIDAGIVIGSDEEFRAAGLSPSALARSGKQAVYVKHGPHGASVLSGGRTIDIPGLDVDVLNGLGAGDAFAAVVGWGVSCGMDPGQIVRLANVAGAIVAERLACSAAMPTLAEVRERADGTLEHVG